MPERRTIPRPGTRRRVSQADREVAPAGSTYAQSFHTVSAPVADQGDFFYSPAEQFVAPQAMPSLSRDVGPKLAARTAPRVPQTVQAPEVAQAPVVQQAPPAQQAPVTPITQVAPVIQQAANLTVPQTPQVVSGVAQEGAAPERFDWKGKVFNNPNLMNVATGGANLLAAAMDREQDPGKKSVAGSALSAGATGFKMGQAFGPIGGAVGAVAGGVIGAIGAKRRNEETDRLNKEAIKAEQASLNMRNMQASANTQSPMYEEGTPAAAMTGPVEVERDELVMRKNSLGKYTVVADFKGGKTHAQGGEDYNIQEGDVVFPGNKRQRVMSLLKQKNHAGIESERLKLPREVPADGELTTGVDATGKFNYTPSALTMNFGRKPVTTGITPSWLSDSPLTDEVIVLRNQVAVDNLNNPKVVVPAKDLTVVGAAPPAKVIASTAPPPEAVKDPLGGINETLRYIPAATNMIKGMRKPEKVTRRFFTPETIRHKDMSDGIRQEVAVQNAIDNENASRFSGGSGQAARAGKALAGSQKLQRLQEINANEAARADQIEMQNVGQRNQAKGMNIELAGRYDDMDAMNRAAIDAYFDQGVHDMGRISSQISRDKLAYKSQDVALGIMDTRDFDYDKKGNRIRFKRRVTPTTNTND